MHGLQLWVALPEDARRGAPRFSHHPTMPVLRHGAATVTVVVGEFDSVRSPARVHTPLVGAEVVFAGPDRQRLPAEPGFEYAVLVMSGAADVDGVGLAPGSLLYLGRGRSGIGVDVAGPARIFVLGGEPFDEPLVMWWNFVARSHEEIARARDDWMRGDPRFGPVAGCTADPLPAPAMPTVRLKARDRHGHTSGGRTSGGP
jgi:redox-sensitive bicupin YhaK (pirin superfamily)